MDYLNKVEIKGTLTFAVTYRKAPKGNVWCTFAITTRSQMSKVNKAKSVYTSTQCCAFDEDVVQKIKRLGIHCGSKVWLVGSLFAKKVEKNGVVVPYTSVVIHDIEAIAPPKKIKKG